MKRSKKHTGFSIIKIVFSILLLHYGFFANSQNVENSKIIDHFSGKVTVTHNGISLIPSFSLEDPAVIFNLNIAKKNLSFEPELRFALEGKPWSFLFWWRYKVIKNEKFNLRIGAHPALNFRTIDVISNGVFKQLIESRRFLAGELAPSYTISKKVKAGMYYLYSHGFDDSAKNTHFLVINSLLSNINLTEKIYLSFSPQFYYLKMDKPDGFYFASFLNISKQDFPLSVAAIFNKKIKTDILPEKDLVWNISLVYSFR
ncbi:hypothetical protein [Abyssalbus ytuae]|uniref:Uncharacterized protein n=1 Tax=Abyssalbus ytuae TaxID=2926907 RepID=A0A9E6ZL33_9FLAO|nr:hypothetical protein [Abyssalbus ytuae]UOB16095.1 hypothetical protein MQE35_10130 [Abyssalbus ytuae]